MPKAETITVRGTVRKVEMREFPHPDPFIDRYSPSTVTKVKKLLVALVTDDGRDVWFFTPGVDFWVTCPVGCPIGVYGISQGNEWIVEGEGVHDAERHSSGAMPVATVAEGDVVTVRGRVKHAATRYGLQLNYIKRLA